MLSVSSFFPPCIGLRRDAAARWLIRRHDGGMPNGLERANTHDAPKNMVHCTSTVPKRCLTADFPGFRVLRVPQGQKST